MGQSMCCLGCRSYNTKVVPLGTLPNTKCSNASLLARNRSFHRPVQIELKSRSSWENLSTEISNRSSLATISLGSVQTLVSSKGETADCDLVTEDNQRSSPSNKRHPGLLTPEPDEGLVNPLRLSTICEAPQGYNSPVPRRIHASQSRSEQPLRITSFVHRAPTPRPDGRANAIVVKPCKASTASIPEETELERVCSHGILLAGGNGDPHIVKCTLCEKPGTSKRDSLP